MNDLISRQWLMECVNEGWIKFDTEKDDNCPNCKKPGTAYISRYNGHKHFRCEYCGMAFME